ncbi:MAG: hypothetical protein PHF46_04230 [Candidatus Gracilibacteria bacterium]|nr:hypothetical protein [Candidatus Gracilibacteria bacterium]
MSILKSDNINSENVKTPKNLGVGVDQVKKLVIRTLGESQETPINNGEGVLLKNTKLYHGSTSPSINKFRISVVGGATLGEGIYFTSNREIAKQYSYARKGDYFDNMDGFFCYEVIVDNLKMLDLRGSTTSF